jgi:N-acetylmuramoyl-L-alanine amidase
VKEANFQVLRETECPAVLVEVAFLSNKLDRQLLTGYAGKFAAAMAIAAGVVDYFAA